MNRIRHLFRAVPVALVCAALLLPSLAAAQTLGKTKAGELRFTYRPRTDLKIVYGVDDLFDTVGYVENIYRLGKRPTPYPSQPKRDEFESQERYTKRYEDWKGLMRYVKYKPCNMAVPARFIKVHQYDIEKGEFLITVTLEDDKLYVGAVTGRPFHVGTGPKSFASNSAGAMDANNLLRLRLSVPVSQAKMIREGEEDLFILIRRVKPYINLDGQIQKKPVLAVFVDENTTYELRMGEERWPLVLESTGRR